jgi:hypothetical protein
LRYKPAATVDLVDPFLKNVILSALDNAKRLTDLFAKNKYDLLLTSYCTYIQHGIAVRVAHKCGVKVVSFGNYDQLAKVVEPELPLHVKNYPFYKEYFDKFSNEEKNSCLDLALKSLNRRFSGGVDNSTFYMSKSSYHHDELSEKVFNNSEKKRIVVFLHDFFDSPHIYRDMLYPDFYEWLNRTLDILVKSGNDIYIKPHPNGIFGNEPVVEEVLKNFPQVKEISKNTSNKALIKEGFDLAVTVYGTLGHEMPYFGIPVLNAGDNPHINFRFCTHALSREEYEQKLVHIDQIQKPIEESKTEIGAFYYMHNFYPFPGKLPMDENKFINVEIRTIKNEKEFSKFLQKNKENGYAFKIEQLIESATKGII